MLGESYVITDGLIEGEEIVTSGTFSVDAAAQLEGKPSMMNLAVGNNSIVFGVSGNCEMCKDRIEKAALSVKGVKSALWDVTVKKIHIDYDSNMVQLSEIHKAIAKAGHDTEMIKADDATYKSLPECCLYRK
jgi:Cu(I)/Ag(I) efflux system membrane fusion protein